MFANTGTLAANRTLRVDLRNFTGPLGEPAQAMNYVTLALATVARGSMTLSGLGGSAYMQAGGAFLLYCPQNPWHLPGTNGDLVLRAGNNGADYEITVTGRPY